MAAIDRAMDKWKRHTSGDEWKANVQGKEQSYRDNLAAFAGISPSQVAVADEWRTGVDNVSAQDFNDAVAGKADKWRNNFLSGIQSD